MATIMTNNNLIPIAAIPSLARGARPAIAASTFRRRRIDTETGRAIEMLGHAIEYLADEFALDCMSQRVGNVGAPHPQIAAIELLMARNREVYFACPEVPTVGERLRSLLHLQRA